MSALACASHGAARPRSGGRQTGTREAHAAGGARRLRDAPAVPAPSAALASADAVAAVVIALVGPREPFLAAHTARQPGGGTTAKSL